MKPLDHHEDYNNHQHEALSFTKCWPFWKIEVIDPQLTWKILIVFTDRQIHEQTCQNDEKNKIAWSTCKIS